MKFRDLTKFIDEEIEQIVKSEKQKYKPVTINIKKVEAKVPTEKELEEMDFEEIMFKKLDESIIRTKIRNILLEDLLPGGLGDDTDPDTLDQRELSMGKKDEMEHTNDPKKAKEIAIDHLTKNPHMYSDMKKAGLDEDDRHFTAQSNPIDVSGKKRDGKVITHEVYHNSFSNACQEAIDFAKKRGYDVDENDWFNQVSTGSRKPDVGKTNRYSVELTKNGQPTNKYLHFQVYGMEGGKYELNAYLSSK